MHNTIANLESAMILHLQPTPPLTMSTSADFARMLGERVRQARLAADWSQDQLAQKMGFNDRQTVSTIETGARAVTAEELVRLTELFGKSLAFFTDPYVVAEKRAFSYRVKPTASQALGEFESSVERLIGAQRRFRQLLGESSSLIQQQLSVVSRQSPLDFASFLGERTGRAWNLGDVPAANLREAIERELGASVMYVDAPEAISGAACRLSDGDFIFINRNEPRCRQNFDLGHELFHLLTWEKMRPERVDAPGTRTPVERLADAFTAGLLMPGEVVNRSWQKRGGESVEDWLHRNALELRVSAEALSWRLVNLGLIKKDAIDLKTLGRSGGLTGESRPNLYSTAFVSRLHRVLDRGCISVLKAAELLECSPEDLKALFAAYKLPAPFAF